MLGAGCDGFSCTQHLAGLPLPSEGGTSGFQVVPAGLEYRAGCLLAKILINHSWLLLLGPTVGCFVWFGLVLLGFFNGIMKKA